MRKMKTDYFNALGTTIFSENDITIGAKQFKKAIGIRYTIFFPSF